MIPELQTQRTASHGPADAGEACSRVSLADQTPAPAQDPDAPATADVLRAALRRDSNMILLADDDEALRTVTGRLLQLLKFNVVQAIDGVDAIESFQRAARTFRGVLLDITMPNLDGVSAAQRIRTLDPSLPIVFLTGGDVDEISRSLPAGLANAVVQKPFTVAGIRKVMDRCFA